MYVCIAIKHYIKLIVSIRVCVCMCVCLYILVCASIAEPEITVGHRTFSNQIWQMSGQF